MSRAPTFTDIFKPHASQIVSLRLYPALPYMERVATEYDVIPLRQPVRLLNGEVTQELYISPGQVSPR